MKKLFTTLFVFLIAICGGLVGVGLQPQKVEAVSSSASVWDGTQQTSDAGITSLDFYTSGNEYYIRSAKGFSYFVNLVNQSSGSRTFEGGFVYLETDIDLGGHEWTPIGGATSNNVFKGDFSGEGHYIYNMKITNSNAENIGLFGHVGSSGSVRAVHLRNAKIEINGTSKENVSVGAIVGKLDGILNNSSVTGKLSFGKETSTLKTLNVGGAVGKMADKRIYRVMSATDISVGLLSLDRSSVSIGGVVGSVISKATMEECFHTGKISAQNGNVGGLIGYAESTNSAQFTRITNCYNSGEIFVTYQYHTFYVGGLVGCVGGQYYRVSNSYNSADIEHEGIESSTTCRIAGIVCFEDELDHFNLKLLWVYNVGEVESARHIYNKVEPYQLIYHDGDNSNLPGSQIGYDSPDSSSFCIGHRGEYGVFDADIIKSKDFYSGINWGAWDFTSTWAISAGINSSLPYLVNVYNAGNANNDPARSTLKGDGSAQAPYLIETAGDLAWVSQNHKQGKYYSLQNDIDLKGKTWIPIGTESKPFSGVFEGNKKTISGLTCSLHEPFGNHGLFGVTKNAVIKNLVVNRVEYLSPSSIEPPRTSGAFIGLAKGNTYLINCREEIGATHGGKSVGKVFETGAKLFVVWGKLNTNTDTGALMQNSLSFDSSDAGRISYGYDIVVSGEGGIFYNKDKQVYIGEYHIILDNSWKILTIQADDGTIIDSGYGQTLLPTTSESWGEKDIIIRRKHKLTGYKYQSDDTTVNASAMQDKATHGLYACWKEDKITVRVYYNSDAKRHLNSEKMDYSADSKWQVTEDGWVYIDYKLDRDARLCDYREALRETPTSNGETMRNGDYEICCFYEDLLFHNKLDFDTRFINDNTEKEIFAEWKGKTDVRHNLTINFLKNEGVDDFSNQFDISDALKSISMTEYDGNPVNTKEGTFVYAQNGASAQVSFGTCPFWTVENGNNTVGMITFDLQVNSGYTLESQIVATPKDPKFDPNFGTLTIMAPYQMWEPASSTLYSLEQFNNVEFANLVGDYEINIVLRRQEYTKDISISQDTRMAIAPLQDFDSVAVVAGAQELSLSSVLADPKTNYYTGRIGFDFVNNLIISASDEYDAVQLDPAYFSDNRLTLKYVDGTDINYYIFEKTTEEETEVITLYKADINKVKTDRLVKYNVTRGKISYLTKSDFALIFSTESDEIIFGGYMPASNIDPYCEVSKLKTPVSKPTKLMMEFEDLQETTNENGEDELPQIVVQTLYTNAVFMVDLKYRDKDGNLVSKPNAPKATITPANVHLEEDGTIKIMVEASDYYKFMSDTELIFDQSDGEHNISVAVDSPNVSDSNHYLTAEAYSSSFNLNTKNWFDGASVVIHKKDNVDYLYDTHEINLPFKSDLSNRYALLPGQYQITIIYTDVEYQITTRVKFVDYADGQSILQNETDKLSELENKIHNSTNSDEEDHDITIDASKTEKIYFSEEIELESKFGENYAYEFIGWYFVGEFGAQFVQSSESNIKFEFSEKYNVNETSIAQKSRFNLQAYAIYQRKMATINIAEEALVKAYNGGEDLKIQITDLGLTSIHLEDASARQYNSLVYNYKSKTEENSQLQNLTWKKLGNNRDGYYFAGYYLYNASGETVKEVLTDLQEDFDVYDEIRDYLKTGQEETANQTFTLVPVIKQKTAKLYFHSGTGDSSNQYGDTKNGTVFDAEGNETTEVVFEFDNAYFDSIYYLHSQMNGEVNGEAQEIAPDNLFASRVGYDFEPLGEYWMCEEVALNGPILNLTAEYFAEVEQKADLHIHHLWNAKTYDVHLMANTGAYTDGAIIKTFTATYDSPLDVDNIKTSSSQVYKEGYQLDGWNLQTESGDVKIFGIQDSELTLLQAEPFLDADGNYHFPDNAILNAIWKPGKYKVGLNFNGADGLVVDGEQYQVGDLEVQIDYDETFSKLQLDGKNVKLSDIIPSRTAFKFIGFYALVGSSKHLVTDDTLFNKVNSYIRLSDVPAATLYAVWEFDTTYLNIEFENSVFESLTYNAQEQTVYIADKFEQSNIKSKEGFDIQVNGKVLNLGVVGSNNTEILLAVNTLTATPSDDNNSAFVVKNAGDYSATLLVVVRDTQQTEGAELLNLGTVQTLRYEFSITVEKAEIYVTAGDIENDSENLVYLESIRRVSAYHIDNETKATLASYSSFGQLVEFVKEKDETAKDATHQEIYDFLIVKFFNLICEKNGDLYMAYKQWSYKDFDEYKSENIEDVETILNWMKYFTFYDNTATAPLIPVEGYNSISVVPVGVSNVKSELTISQIMLNKRGSQLTPRGVYSLDLYFEVDEVIQNYEVSYSVDNRPFINIGRVYVLPQIIEIENNGLNAGYYQGQYNPKQVEWYTDMPNIVYDEETYYEIQPNLYVHANLYTSNEGSSTEDTQFNFVDFENYLYFRNVKLLQKTGVEFSDVTNFYSLVMNQDDVFTILNIEGVSKITVSAKYFTKNGSNMEFLDIKDIPDASIENILNIASIVYNLNGVTKTLNNLEGIDGTIVVDETFLGEIYTNNANEVEILLNSAITTVNVNASTTAITDYIKLYKWADLIPHAIDGTMETNGRFEINIGDLELKENQISEFSFYAVYTDLVLVNYDLSFPENFRTESSKSSVLKLNSSTVDNLELPDEEAFELASLTIKNQDNEMIDVLTEPEKIFVGNGGVFIGFAGDIFAPLNFTAKWVAEEISFVKHFETLNAPANATSSITLRDLLYISNKNENLFEYSYSWYKGSTLLSVGEIMPLAQGGSSSESGEYKLVMKLEVVPELYSCLVSDENRTQQQEVTFTLNFLKNKIVEVRLPEENLQATFDNKDHKSDWRVEISYQAYNSAQNKYNDVATTINIGYAEEGEIYSKIQFDSNEVYLIKDVGEYDIEILFDESKYDTSEIDETLKFTFEILPAEIDIGTLNFDKSKEFNSLEPSLTVDQYFSATQEVLTFVSRRESGEDIKEGGYSIFLDDIEDQKGKNYIVKHNGVTLIEKGVLTEEAGHTEIGKFSIVSAVLLRLSYNENSLAHNIQKEYSNLGYSIEISNDAKFKVKKGSSVVDEVALSLIDGATGLKISSTEILAIVNPLLSDVVVDFRNGSQKHIVKDSGRYSYVLTAGEQIRKYFQSVIISNGYSFSIYAQTVDVESFVFEKTYDNTSKLLLSAQGEVIEDLNTFSGLYIEANFMSVHAGEDIRLNLSLKGQNFEEDLSNYVLSSNFAYGTIHKIQSKLVVSLKQNEYVYGAINVNDADSIIQGFDVVDEQGAIKNNLVQSGYFEISYDFSTPPETNAKGYILIGKYKLNVDADFRDFEITEIVIPEFEIKPLKIQKNINPGYIAISTVDQLEVYEEEIVIAQTSDILQLRYIVDGHTLGEILAEGAYDLALQQTEFLSGSVIVELNENNQGLQVLKVSNTVYVRLDNKNALESVYSGQVIILSVDTENKKLKLSNGNETTFSTITRADSGEETAVVATFNSLTISTDGTIKNVGTYRLSISGATAEYTSIAFAESYAIKVTQKEIDINQFTIEKFYDGNSYLSIGEIDEKESGDDLSVQARFNDANADTNKAVQLYLSGASSENYILSNNGETTGRINKTQATLSLVNTNYVYGSLTRRTLIAYKVMAGEVLVADTQYSASITIEDESYSATTCLEAGEYDVNATVTSQNYEISFTTTKIVVTANEIDVVLDKDAEVVAYFGSAEAESNIFEYAYTTMLNDIITLKLEREPGNSVGDYRVIDGESLSDNYVVKSLRDDSHSGFFRIVAAEETIFLLLSEAQEVAAGEGGDKVSIEYDGIDYSTISIREVSDGKYTLLFENNGKTESHEFALSAYVLDEENDKYIKQDIKIEDLEVQLKVIGGECKNVGEYSVYATNTYCPNYQVKFGKDGEAISYKFEILKKQLYFKDQVLEKTFDNENATFFYSDAKELLNGIVGSESLSLAVEFQKEGSVVKYSGHGYDIVATLEGTTTRNYNLNKIFLDEFDSMHPVTGRINKAGVVFTVNSHVFTYGDDIVLRGSYETSVDLLKYDLTTRDFYYEVTFYDNNNFSTGGKLNVGTYEIGLTFRADDFYIAEFVVDGQGRDDVSYATLKINPAKLELQQKDGGKALKEIFTKDYDGEDSVEIHDSEGLMFELSGMIEGDSVTAETANYANSNVGKAIRIDFVLAGADKENYTISPWLHGEIEPVLVSLNFNYKAGEDNVKSNVELNGLQQISQLSFPFMSTSYLTSNSAISQTNSIKNFPTSLSGKVGNTFKFWTLDFVGIANESPQLAFLEDLAKTQLEMDTTYVNEVYSIRVDNGDRTVRLLNALIGEDVNDLMGYYYKNHSSISFTFNANWETNDYDIIIQIADENGNPASHGKVEIFYNDATEAGDVATSGFMGAASHGSKIKLVATANEHCSFYGYYRNGTLISATGDVSAIGNTLTIDSLSGAIQIVARFKIDEASIVLDMTGNSDFSVADSEKFIKVTGENKWIWRTDYLTAESSIFGVVPAVTKTGYTLTGFRTQNFTVRTDDFNTTTFGVFMSDAVENVLTLTPMFSSKGIQVTLDYGFEKTKVISVEFEEKYNTSADWEERPEQEGYEFVGWFDADDNQVTGNTVLENPESHTLTAKWNIKSYQLEFTVFNAEVSSNIIFEESSGTYSNSEIEFATEVVIRILPDEGYEISNTWAPEFDIAEGADGWTEISLIMPAEKVTFDIPVVAKQNELKIIAEHLESLNVFDITTTETEIVESGGVYAVDTGRKIKIEAEAALGYQLTDNVQANVEGLDIDAEVIDGILFIEVTGIASDVEFTLEVLETKNKVTVKFDDNSAVLNVDCGGIYSAEEMPQLEIQTNHSYVFYVKYNHGYEYSNYETEDGFVLDAEYQNSGAYEGYFKIEISNVEKDGQITLTTELKRFTLQVQSISYDNNKEQVIVPSNKTYIKLGEDEFTSVAEKFKTQLTLIAEASESDKYVFVGWTKDGETIINTEASFVYQIEQDETIFAIFSKWSFDISFSTYNRYNIYEEYEDSTKVEQLFRSVSGARYFDAVTGREISNLQLYYGVAQEIEFVRPQGYHYIGYGYWKGDNFEFLEFESKPDERVTINLSSLDLQLDSSKIEIQFIVEAYSLQMQFATMIDYDGVKVADNSVGWIELEDQEQNTVNRYGYLEGTRVHYSAESFANGLVSNRDFKVIAYTGDEFYIKVKTVREGYNFETIICQNDSIEVSLISSDEDFSIYKISKFIGEFDLDANVFFEVIYKPHKNVINLTFANGQERVDAGVFVISTDEVNSKRVWTSGQGYAQTTVLAYTDGEFEVSAYIKVGYKIDPSNIQIENDGIVLSSTISVSEMVVEDTGFVYKIRFIVTNYLGEHNIKIMVSPQTYTVVLREESVEVARIKNVEFGQMLNLSEANSENIVISSDRVKLVNGSLTLTTDKQNYHYEGFFTYQNGAGVQYIDAQGQAVNSWQESGYVFDQVTSKYDQSENMFKNATTGETEISLYLYWSYLKTRISFEFVPSIKTDKTAKDMVTGIDHENSWFYAASPHYIEVAFNTDVRIIAPEIDGYKFYKFVISQQQLDGAWLSDVEAFSDNIPWSTNELDKIVACKIQIVYFAEVNVTILGGEGTFEIQQETSDSQARLLLQKGYVNTELPFTITANASKGYKFIRWGNSDTGEFTTNKSMSMQTTKKVNLVMRLEGLPVTLDFSAYSPKFGQIVSLKAKSLDNSETNFRLGGYSGDEFLKLITQANVKVGDVLTFAVTIDHGFNVKWNRKDINFDSLSSDVYYFKMTVLPESEGQVIEIIPTFSDDFMSFYITRKFAEGEVDPLAIDGNRVDFAGVVYYNGAKTDFFTSEHGNNIKIQTQTFARYKLVEIVLINYNRVYSNLHEMFTEDSALLITEQFIKENSIVGNVQLIFTYARDIWGVDASEARLEGNGTAKNPYQIRTAEDLALMRQLCNSELRNEDRISYRKASYILMADIDLTEKFWIPIGTNEFPFDGLFNFNGHQVTGIYNPKFYSELNYNGLFGVLGPNARIIVKNPSLWHIYLAVGIAVVLILLILFVVYRTKKRKKRTEELSKR